MLIAACNPKAIPTVIFPAKAESPALPPAPAPVAAPKEIKATVNIFARDIVNPDPNGNASPIQVRVFIAPNNTVFEGVSFEQVFEFEGKQFDIKPRFIKTLSPGSLASAEFDIAPKDSYIAIAVAFRNIGRTEWLKQVSIDNSKSFNINFVLSNFSVKHESNIN